MIYKHIGQAYRSLLHLFLAITEMANVPTWYHLQKDHIFSRFHAMQIWNDCWKWYEDLHFHVQAVRVWVSQHDNWGLLDNVLLRYIWPENGLKRLKWVKIRQNFKFPSQSQTRYRSEEISTTAPLDDLRIYHSSILYLWLVHISLPTLQ